MHAFNMITGKNKTKFLTKDISCKCKCKFDGRSCNSDQKWNNNKCWCKCKKHQTCEKDYIWSPAVCNCENEKYWASSIDDWVAPYDEIVEETKTAPTILMKKSSL